MINRKSTFFLGVFIFMIPFFGIPSSWRSALVIIAGAFVIFTSIKITLPKKGARPRGKKERVTPVFVETMQVYPQNDTVEKSSVDQTSEINIDGK